MGTVQCPWSDEWVSKVWHVLTDGILPSNNNNKNVTENHRIRFQDYLQDLEYLGI